MACSLTIEQAGTMKLKQSNLLKGSQEFELLDDAIQVRTKTPFKEKRTSVMLATLNPDPVVNGSRLEFYGRVKCSPVLSFHIDKPDPESFNAFVEALKERAVKEFNAFAGID